MNNATTNPRPVFCASCSAVALDGATDTHGAPACADHRERVWAPGEYAAMTAELERAVADERAVRAAVVKASICIFGNEKIGFYCLGDAGSGTVGVRMFGDIPAPGAPLPYRSATTAVRAMAAVMAEAGIDRSAPLSLHLDDAREQPWVAFAAVGHVPMLAELSWRCGGAKPGHLEISDIARRVRA